MTTRLCAHLGHPHAHLWVSCGDVRCVRMCVLGGTSSRCEPNTPDMIFMLAYMWFHAFHVHNVLCVVFNLDHYTEKCVLYSLCGYAAALKSPGDCIAYAG